MAAIQLNRVAVVVTDCFSNVVCPSTTSTKGLEVNDEVGAVLNQPLLFQKLTEGIVCFVSVFWTLNEGVEVIESSIYITVNYPLGTGHAVNQFFGQSCFFPGSEGRYFDRLIQLSQFMCC